jgi:hypothetical protein
MIMRVTSPRSLVPLFAAVLLQTALSLVGFLAFDLPVSSEIDSVEYIKTADNILASHGFSIENTPPWMPNGFRTPGHLILNIPLRVFSFGSDLLALLISRIFLFGAGLLVVKLAVSFGLSSLASYAGALFVLMPSLSYYSLLPYSTELPYVIACGVFFLATVNYLEHARQRDLLVLGLVSAYALLLRPAALFVLSAYVAVAGLAGLAMNGGIRRRAFLASGVCLTSALIAYGSWSFRNYLAFGSFQFSTVSGYNLLHFNAHAMNPYLDQLGKQELKEAMARHPTLLQRHNGYDQFLIANQQGSEGMRLIRKYPMPFVKSHFEGVILSFALFSPGMLASSSKLAVHFLSVIQVFCTAGGVWGLAILAKTLSPPQIIAVVLVVSVGLISILSGGALASPRFRMPLDVSLAVGCAVVFKSIYEKFLVRNEG